MNSVVGGIAIPKITSAQVSEDTLSVDQEDDRTISVPLNWYARLACATAEEPENYRIAGAGYGIHWRHLDEDVGVEGLLAGKRSAKSAESFERWLASRGAGK